MSAELMKSKFVLPSVCLSSVHIIDYLGNCYANFFQILGVDCTGAYTRFFRVPDLSRFLSVFLTWEYGSETPKRYSYKSLLKLFKLLLILLSQWSSEK